MYAGAAIAAARMICGLVLLIIDFNAGASGTLLGHSVTAMRRTVITSWVVFGLAWVALWLWMAWANGRGRNWARILSTVAFVWLTLSLFNGLLPPGRQGPAGAGAAVLYYGDGVTLAAEWLAGLAAVLLLWFKEDSLAFFDSVKAARPRRPDGPVRPYVRWAGGWAAALVLTGLSFLLFKALRGMVYEGWSLWWILFAAVVFGAMRQLFRIASWLVRPGGWPPERRDGQPPQGDGAAAQQEGGDDEAGPAAQQEGGDIPESK